MRRELCKRLWVRLSRREGQPAPAGVDSITDLDVQCLIETGRPWEVVAAGRQLPQLARLHGWGFVVDVQAVREAELRGKRKAPLGGDTLRSCIQGEGDPPQELLLAAVACAASGTVRGVPVQRLREGDAIGGLDLSGSGMDTGRLPVRPCTGRGPERSGKGRGRWAYALPIQPYSTVQYV